MSRPPPLALGGGLFLREANMGRKILNEKDMKRTLIRMAHKIIEVNRGAKDLVIIGIRTRGVYLAQRLAKIIEENKKVAIPVGSLDINLYRDDFQTKAEQPVVGRTEIPFDVRGKVVILTDDVLFSGRTVRAALDEIIDFGRPKAIQLAVLIDRGHKELPIRADYIGKRISTAKQQEVVVKVQEEDGVDEVVLVEGEEV